MSTANFMDSIVAPAISIAGPCRHRSGLEAPGGDASSMGGGRLSERQIDELLAAWLTSDG
jgi:hypothetical protein